MRHIQVFIATPAAIVLNQQKADVETNSKSANSTAKINKLAGDHNVASQISATHLPLPICVTNFGRREHGNSINRTLLTARLACDSWMQFDEA